MKKVMFFLCFVLINASVLFADQLSFTPNKPITYEIFLEIDFQFESLISMARSTSKTITFDIKLLNSENNAFPFEVEVVVKNLKFNSLNNSDMGQTLVSYDSENHEFTGLHNKIASLYDSIINKPLLFIIDKNKKATETTGTLKKLKQNISKILNDKGIDDISLAEEMDEFDQIICSFFHLANTDIKLKRYDMEFPRIEGVKKGKLYYDISAIDYEKIQYNIGGYMNMALDPINLRCDIDGKAYINKDNALIQSKSTSIDAANTGIINNIPYSITMKGTEKITPVSE